MVAARRIGWDMTAEYFFPTVSAEGDRGNRLHSAARMTIALQGQLRAAELPSHFTMQNFCVGVSLSNSLAETAVNEILKHFGWDMESLAKYYIEATSSGKEHGTKRKCGQRYPVASELPLSMECEKDTCNVCRKCLRLG